MCLCVIKNKLIGRKKIVAFLFWKCAKLKFFSIFVCERKVLIYVMSYRMMMFKVTLILQLFSSSIIECYPFERISFCLLLSSFTNVNRLMAKNLPVDGWKQKYGKISERLWLRLIVISPIYHPKWSTVFHRLKNAWIWWLF